VAEEALRDLVRRRLFELDLTPLQASRRCGGQAPAETIRGLARGQRSIQVGDLLARALALALAIPEYRVRRTAGLPVSEPAEERTRPLPRPVGPDQRNGS
jgi:hypothetical protein